MPMSEALREETQQQTPAPQQDAGKPSMAWHHFLVHFLLFLLPACAVFELFWLLFGRVYYTTEIRNAIYAGICGMRALDRGLCLMLLGEAALLLTAQWKLKRMRREGVRLLLAGHALAAMAWALYGLLRLVIAGLSPLSVPLVGQCAAHLILLLVNRSYYARRSGVWTDCGGKE